MNNPESKIETGNNNNSKESLNNLKLEINHLVSYIRGTKDELYRLQEEIKIDTLSEEELSKVKQLLESQHTFNEQMQQYAKDLETAISQLKG